MCVPTYKNAQFKVKSLCLFTLTTINNSCINKKQQFKTKV